MLYTIVSVNGTVYGVDQSLMNGYFADCLNDIRRGKPEVMISLEDWLLLGMKECKFDVIKLKQHPIPIIVIGDYEYSKAFKSP